MMTRAALRKVATCTTLVLLTISGAQSRAEEPLSNDLLGAGRGVDHVMIAVRDINRASDFFSSHLGFNAKIWGKFPDGVENAGTYFGNRSYLELLGIYDRNKAAQTTIAKLLEKHEGALGMALHVSSAERAARFLKSRGFDVKGPTDYPSAADGAQNADPWWWRTVSFDKPTLPGGDVFLIEYNEQVGEDYRKKDPQGFDAARTHPNTAKHIESVCVAVKDLKRAVKAYESIGLSTGRQVRLPHFGATGREILAGAGVVMLLQANNTNSMVASFIEMRGEAIMGLSIKVAELDTARKILETNIKQTFTPYEGAYGRSVLVPAEVTHGVWVEMFQ